MYMPRRPTSPQRRPKPQFKGKSNGMLDIRWPASNTCTKCIKKAIEFIFCMLLGTKPVSMKGV